jgi:hypothetical protein
MDSTKRPTSVRALGARRLKQATVGMVALSVAGVAGLVGHEAQQAHASTTTPSSTSTSTAQGTATDGTTDSSGTSNDMSNSSTSSTINPTESMPQATSGGS